MSSPRIRRGERVLVTRLSYLGDVVLSLPLVDALHDEFPGVEIDYLAREPGASLLADDARFARVWTLRPGVRATVSLARELRARRFGAVIDLYSNPRSAWLTWFTRAPIRVGRHGRRRRAYTDTVRLPAAVRPVTEVFLAYGAVLGITTRRAGKPVLAVPAPRRATAEGMLSAAGAPAGRLRVGVHPGGKWPVKRWPAEKFAELVSQVRERAAAQIVLFTGPGERGATDAVRARCSSEVIVLPALEVRDAAAIIAQLDAVVACDGGIMHVAAAVGTPTVGIFGSSECERWFPYEPFGPFRAARIDVPCRPCHRHVCPLGTTACLNGLSAPAVWTELEHVLSEGARLRSPPR